jgi:hypothetical protein
MDSLLHDLNERLQALFRRCPELHGFAVRLDRPIPCELTCHPPQHAEQAEAALGEVAQMLSELLEERPEAAAVLRGRTFARTLH